MITVSAPGKLLLLGEHAVVYGYPCLVAAVDMRLSVTVSIIESGQTSIHAPDSADTRLVEAAVAIAKTAWEIVGPFIIETKSSFSGKYGFGSSAAVVVATLYALAVESEKSVSKEELFHNAFAAIQTIQPQASGADVAAAIWGGIIRYSKNGEKIDSLAVTSVPLVVAYSGEKADTPAIVAEVAEKKKQYSASVEKIFLAMSQLVSQGKIAIEAGEWDRFGVTMNFTQEYLRDLGVSSTIIESLLKAASDAGAWGAKLSGAGRGDCIIALVPDGKRQSVIDALNVAGGEVVPLNIGAEGVRVDL